MKAKKTSKNEAIYLGILINTKNLRQNKCEVMKK
jgi:hypothetical protein